jgi:phosphate transport system substrate-binding protein
MGGELGRMARGLPFTRSYEALEDLAEVIKAVAEDPYGIGLVDFMDADAIGSLVRLVPLAEGEGAAYYSPTYENVRAGRYPYSPYLRLYAIRAPGKPLDPFVKEYARLALSQEGQAIIAALKDTGLGYVPLGAGEVAEELAKLE